MVDSDEAKLVLARLRTMSPNLELNIVGYGTFTRESMIEEVSKLLSGSGDTELGEVIVENYMEGLQALKVAYQL